MKYIFLIVLAMLLIISITGCASVEKRIGQVSADASSANEQQPKYSDTSITDAAGALAAVDTDAAAAESDITEAYGNTTGSDNVDESDKKAVTDLIGEFGKRLKTVSLLAPKDILDKSMEDSYGGLVAPKLIALWQKDPQNAPGRMVSSPWPERIDILSLDKKSDIAYEARGTIIELTSNEVEHGGIAAKRPVTISAEKKDGRWIIVSVELGKYL